MVIAMIIARLFAKKTRDGRENIWNISGLILLAFALIILTLELVEGNVCG